MVTHTEQTELQEMDVVKVDNCEGWLQKSETYRSPYAGNSVGVENLTPNGGEPFKSIKTRIWDMYAEPVDKITLSVPAHTQREFTLLLTRYNYRGIVEGEIIEANKIDAHQAAVYFYPFNANVEIEAQRDIPCTP